MKQLFYLSLTLILFVSCNQTTATTEKNEETNNTEEAQENRTEKTLVYRIVSVSFETVFDITTGTKDGFYVEDYIIHIDYTKASEIDGKKVKISGEITTVSGLNNTPQEYDEEGNEIIMQGRAGDTGHIFEPKIEILEE